VRAEAETAQTSVRAELDAVRSVQAEAPPEALPFVRTDEPSAVDSGADDSGLDDDLLLDDIPGPSDAVDTGDFTLEDDEEEAPAQDAGDTAILSLDDEDDHEESDEPVDDKPAAEAPVAEEPAAEEMRGEAEALPKGDPVSCTACDAMGSCRRCGGRGRRFGRRCADCNGSGTCSVCGGPGYIWVEEPVVQRAG
jgi:hypothetical protein